MRRWSASGSEILAALGVTELVESVQVPVGKPVRGSDLGVHQLGRVIDMFQAHHMAELVQEVPPQVWSETLLKSGFIHQHVAVVGLVGEKRASDQAWIFAGAVAQDEGGVFDFLDLSDLVK